MKKTRFFSAINGVMWSFIAKDFGYRIDDFQWWAIFIIGIITTTIIYSFCKD